MRTKPLTVLAICATLTMSILATSPTFAGSYPKKSKSKATPVPVDTNDKITALHLTAVTVTIAATHQSKEFKVTPATKIIVNGQPGTLSSLAVGMDVSVTPAPNDPTTAAEIDAKTRR